MKLHDLAVSGNCYKVRLLFAQLGIEYERIPHELIPLDERDDSLRRGNPASRLPLVEFDDGKTLAESNAILCYFAEGTPFLPSDPFERARAMQWLFFEQNQHEPNVATAHYWKFLSGRAEEKADVFPTWLERGQEALDAMDRQLAQGPFILGERYSICDIALFAYTQKAKKTGYDVGANIERWMNAMREQPGYVALEG